jgi:cation:H+ antiporter
MPVPLPPISPLARRGRAIAIGGVVLVQPLDLVIGVLVGLFFVASALINSGQVGRSLAGATAVMAVMFLVGACIELIIESLRDVRGLGTLAGFITNGPEALCLIVGLAARDVLYAASTPLGSNFMNPLLLVVAGLITGSTSLVFRDHRLKTITTLIVTAALAGVFFLIPPRLYPGWLVITLIAATVLFWIRPSEPLATDDDPVRLPRWAALPAVAVLVVAGYLLDPVVGYTADASHAPKGVIGFFVLAALTSWPEFKSCLALFRRRRPLASVLNITVSNLTNLWLATLGVIVHLLTR